MTEGSIAQWHKSIGEYVEAGELIVEIATDKATIEHHLADPGFLRKILVEQGERAQVGKPLAVLTADEKEPLEGYLPQEVLFETAVPCSPPSTAAASVAPFGEKAVSEPSTGRERLSASPLAKKIALRENISLSGLRGTGPGGRIMSRDLEQLRSKQAVLPAPSYPVPQNGAFESLTPMRQVIGKRLQQAKATIPHFYVSSQIEVCALVEQREELKAAGHHITVNDLLIKATALALMDHRSLRCSFFPDREQIFVHDHADVAVAVSIPGGLVTPVVFEAEKKASAEISQEIKRLADKARAGKLQPHEYLNGACTITNLGMYGVDEFIPILNPPQVAIVAVGAIADVPVVRGGVVVPGKVVRLTVSGDHRAVDGADAAAFLKTMKELLQHPSSLVGLS